MIYKGTKLNRLRSNLLSVIASSVPASRLPSERALAKQFRVSRETVRRALDRLMAEGKIERRRPLGTFVAPPRRGNTVLFVSYGNPPYQSVLTWFPPFLLSFLAALRTADNSLLVAHCDSELFNREAQSLRSQYPGLAVVVLFNVPTSLAACQVMTKIGIRVIYFGSDVVALPQNISGLLFRESEVVQMAIEHFYLPAHVEIAIWGPNHYDFVKWRERVFSREVISRGLKGVAIPGRMTGAQQYDRIPFPSDEVTVDWLRKKGKPLAVFSTTDVGALQFANIVWLSGKKMPRDIQIIGVEGSPLGELAAVPVSCVRLPLAEAGELCVSRILDLLGGGKPQIDWLRANWVERQTTIVKSSVF